MQIPPMEKLLALPAESLSMTSQFCFCLAEIGNALLAGGCAQRAVLLRDMLASAIPRLPSGRDLASFIADGDTKLGVLWRNYFCLLLSVGGGTLAQTTRVLHPDAEEVRPSSSRCPLQRSSPAMRLMKPHHVCSRRPLGRLLMCQVRRGYGLERDAISALAEVEPIGCDGLTLLPYLVGERTPNWPGASGCVRTSSP